MKRNKHVTIIIAGGSGNWSEQNHYPALTQLQQDGFSVSVKAIIDPHDPYTLQHKKHLSSILHRDNPQWINPANKTTAELEKELHLLSTTIQPDLMIIATDPVYHQFYSKWSIEHNIHVVCDKPIVVTKDASWKPSAAKTIQRLYDELEKLYFKRKQTNEKYLFITPLRRRVLTPFIRIADELGDMYTKTGEGIRYMTMIINGGLHRYPVEFLKGGAHGYLNGVGSLAHSSYHYIDVIAWFLQQARGDTSAITLTLPYVSRVEDYIKTKKYSFLQSLVEKDRNTLDNSVVLPESVLHAELDFTVHMQLQNQTGKPNGLISYSANHMTFTPRTAQYNPVVIDHANQPDGGRMSQIYMDIHQGAVQNWQLIKNDVVSQGENISLIGRKHPNLGDVYIQENYTNAYESGMSPKDILQQVIRTIVGEDIEHTQLSLVATFETQRLSQRLFSLMYELLAEEYDVTQNGLQRSEKKVILDTSL